MGIGFFEAILFALGLEKHKRKKEEELWKYIQERHDGIIIAISKFNSAVSDLMRDVGAISFPEHLSAEKNLVPYFAVWEVLSEQRMIYEEQKWVVMVLFRKPYPDFSLDNYMQAAIDGKEDFDELMQGLVIDKDRCGDFWHFVFEMIYRTRKIEKLQEIVDNLTMMVVNFGLLGNRQSPYPKAICDRLLQALNFHINEYQKNPCIRAIMLLAVILSEKMKVGLDEQIAVYGENVQLNNKNCYTFIVSYKVTFRFLGRYAVQEGSDEDRIYMWDEEHNQYNILYEE